MNNILSQSNCLLQYIETIYRPSLYSNRVQQLKTFEQLHSTTLHYLLQAIKALEKRLHSKASNIGLIGVLFTLCQSHRLKITFVSKT